MKDRIHRAPVAITSDGMFVVNVASADGAETERELVERALQQGGRKLFIGVLLEAKEMPVLRRKLDDSAADAVAWLWGACVKAKARKTASAAPAEKAQRRRRTARKS